MKKRIISVLICIVLLIGIFPIQAFAASYPTVICTVESCDTIIDGQTGVLNFSILRKYNQEKLHVEIYNSDDEIEGSSTTNLYSYGNYLQEVNVSIDTKDLELGVGTYYVKYWMEFYTFFEWRTAPNTYKHTVKVIPNTCNGNHKLVEWLVFSEPTCEEEGRATYECTTCGHKVFKNTPKAHNYTDDKDTSCDTCGQTAYPGGDTLVYENGAWYHVVNRQKVNDITLVNLDGTWYYVKNGKVDFKATTLVKYGNSWYYVQKGVLKWGVETLVNYGGTWYYVKNSTVDFKAETLCNYYGTWYYVKNGVVDWDSDTLCNYYGTWYYVKNGTVKWNAKTLVKYGKDWFYVQNGQLKWGVETLVNYYGTWYYVKNSTVNFKANLKFNYYGTYYNVVNGVVKF